MKFWTMIPVIFAMANCTDIGAAQTPVDAPTLNKPIGSGSPLPIDYSENITLISECNHGKYEINIRNEYRNGNNSSFYNEMTKDGQSIINSQSRGLLDSVFNQLHHVSITPICNPHELMLMIGARPKHDPLNEFREKLAYIAITFDVNNAAEVSRQQNYDFGLPIKP